MSREAWRQLTEIAEGISGEPPDVVSAFFANGVLLTIFMSMQALRAAGAVGRPDHEELLDRTRAVTDAGSFFSPSRK